MEVNGARWQVELPSFRQAFQASIVSVLLSGPLSIILRRRDMRAALFLVLAGAVAGCGGSGGSSTSTQVFTSLAVAPTTSSVAPGATTQLSATPKDQNGHTMSGIGAATWSSADATIASVDANSGLVTGVAAGGPVA